MTPVAPDFLRRFVPASHVDTLRHQYGLLRVESNDADFARELRNCFQASESGAILQAIEYLKILVEDSVIEDGNELTCMDTDFVSTLLRGTTTLLVYDSESRELFAFLHKSVSCGEFFNRLLPLVICNEADSIIF
jgi:hypothetical protein